MVGAVRATGVVSALARSSGKLCFHFGLYLHHTLYEVRCRTLLVYYIPRLGNHLVS